MFEFILHHKNVLDIRSIVDILLICCFFLKFKHTKCIYKQRIFINIISYSIFKQIITVKSFI